MQKTRKEEFASQLFAYSAYSAVGLYFLPMKTELLFKEESCLIIGACLEVYREKGCGFLDQRRWQFEDLEHLKWPEQQ